MYKPQLDYDELWKRRNKQIINDDDFFRMYFYCQASDEEIKILKAGYEKGVDVDLYRKMVDRYEGHKHTIRFMQESLEEKNKELAAMHYVWCSGGCEGGVGRYGAKKPTKDDVKRAKRNIERLISWYNNRQFKTLDIKDRYDYLSVLEPGWIHGIHWKGRVKAYWKVALLFFAIGAIIF